MESTLIIAISLAIGIFGIMFLLKSANKRVKLIIYGCLACFFLIYFIVKKEYASLIFVFLALAPIVTFLFNKNRESGAKSKQHLE